VTDVMNGKVVVITGGTSGIGARTAECLVNEGARVVLAGRRQHRGEEVMARLGPAAVFVATDVTSEPEVRALIAHATERFGRLDCLVNNAGDGGTPASVRSLDLQDLRRAFEVHVMGAAAGIKYAAPIMIEQGSGSIVNVSSVSARLAGWSATDYSAVKAALVHYSRCTAAELGAYGIRVNTVSPGPILTGIQAKTAGVDPDHADDDPDVLQAFFTDRLNTWQPFNRVGVPQDVASAIVWLASDASAFVTGHDLVVDGGLSIGRPARAAAADRAAIADHLSSSVHAARPERSTVYTSNRPAGPRSTDSKSITVEGS
jgi:NAD(P)-dependent dehydrogenase (short-subunit alcohol dehydrogenase family)